MAYDDSRYRGEPGFREERAFGAGGVPEDAPSLGNPQGTSIYSPGAYPVADYGPLTSETTLGGGRRAAPTAAQLDNVFDDPAHGDPGRDRMAVHAVWEIVLLVAALVLAFLLRDASPGALRGAELKALLLTAAGLGMVTLATGLCLRAGAPNLALGPLFFACALFFAQNSGRGLAATAAITALVAIGVGVAIAVLTVGLHVPAWAASLAAALGVIVWIQQRTHDVHVVNGAYNPLPHAMYWFAGFVVLGLAGGLLGLARPIRRSVGRFRPVGDPARRRGTGAGVVTALALVGSSLLVAVGGVLLALTSRTLSQADIGLSASGLSVTGLALGAALLGGTSAFGRRGGIAGTVLAVVTVVLFVRYADVRRWHINELAIAGATIAIGLVVTRLVEAFGRPRDLPEGEEEAEWSPSTTGVPGDAGWSGSRTGGWTSQLPARATDDGWGTEERWNTR